MQLAIEESTDYQSVAFALAKEFAETAAQRDAQGGTPKYERDKLRESGLLKLIIPQEYGGIGETWPPTLKIGRDFAKVDSSIAHVFSYHLHDPVDYKVRAVGNWALNGQLPNPDFYS